MKRTRKPNPYLLLPPIEKPDTFGKEARPPQEKKEPAKTITILKPLNLEEERKKRRGKKLTSITEEPDTSQSGSNNFKPQS